MLCYGAVPLVSALAPFCLNRTLTKTACHIQKLNVLPSTAVAHVNHRILNGDTVASVVDHDRHAVTSEHVKVDLEAGSVCRTAWG